MNEKLLSIGKAALILGVHVATLRNWDKDGTLTPVKTPGKHRRYRMSDIEAFCSIKKEEIGEENCGSV